jgi:predicted RNA binding protein YcfA (HicA-like mRNA interferase family)
MKLPRDIDGAGFAKALRVLGYEVTRQKGSHIRVTTQVGGEHHEVVPSHRPLKPGTLASLLKSIAKHHQMTSQELTRKLGIS